MNISHKLLIALSTTITIALPISQCAQAASYVVNNENIDKDGRQAYTGSYNRAAKQQTVKQMGPQNREAFKEDKLFKAPKNKQPIRKSENRSQNGGKQYSLNDQRTFTTIDNRTNQDEQTTATLKYDGKKPKCGLLINTLLINKRKTLVENLMNVSTHLSKTTLVNPLMLTIMVK